MTTQSNEQTFQGTISGNQVWTSDKIYRVTGNVGIAPGVTLTIQPGTVVKFTGNYTLSIGGTLIADGTAEQPIVFTSGYTGTWNRILFDDPSVDAVADVDGVYQERQHPAPRAGAERDGGIGCNSATPYLAHLTVTGGGINCTLGDTAFWLLDSAVTGDVSGQQRRPCLEQPGEGERDAAGGIRGADQHRQRQHQPGGNSTARALSSGGISDQRRGSRREQQH